MNVSKKAVFAALTAVLTLGLGGAFAPAATAAPMTAKAVASPKSVMDCNNNTQQGDWYIPGNFATCDACLKQVAWEIDHNSVILYTFYCTYNPSLRHYDLHGHKNF
ncbi:hypothetical protein ACIRVK_39890 [Streptomyces sp. NPDC101152]|uniref:hypothetical protein n=1 Tax=Streptomyces sp. NPDC101152 TaxID=3366116 RepID=UPI003805C088